MFGEDFLKLNKTISQDSNTDPNDVLHAKTALNKAGKYEIPSYGLTDVPDMKMIDGIKSFQKDNGLKVDGIMKPGGPTQNKLDKVVKKVSPQKAKAPKPNFAKPNTPPRIALPHKDGKPVFGGPVKDFDHDNLSDLIKYADPKDHQLGTVRIQPVKDEMVGTSPNETTSSANEEEQIMYKTYEKKDGSFVKVPIAVKPGTVMPTIVEKLPSELEDKAVPLEGNTVQQRLQSLMKDPRYQDKNNSDYRNHVVSQFEKAYPGEVKYDETGKMIQPEPSIQPGEVEPFGSGEIGKWLEDVYKNQTNGQSQVPKQSVKPIKTGDPELDRKLEEYMKAVAEGKIKDPIVYALNDQPVKKSTEPFI